MTNINTCFSCGEAIKGDKCSSCGYSFSLAYKCPKLINEGIVCAVIRKLCREGQKWEQCSTLHSN